MTYNGVKVNHEEWWTNN